MTTQELIFKCCNDISTYRIYNDYINASERYKSIKEYKSHLDIPKCDAKGIVEGFDIQLDDTGEAYILNIML